MKKTSMKKKTIAAAAAFCMMAATAAPISASEAKAPESAAYKADAARAAVDTANDTWESPAAISLGVNYESEITEANAADYYKFTIPSPGTVNLAVSSYIDKKINYSIYSLSGGEKLWSESGTIDSVSRRYYGNHGILFTQGTYVIEVTPGSGSLGKYNLTVSHTPSGESFPESGDDTNNSMETASPISLGATYKGLIALNDVRDFYKFSAKTGKFIITVSNHFSSEWIIFNKHGQQVASETVFGQMSESGTTETKRVTLSEAGDYYFCVQAYYPGSNGYTTGDYTFSITEYIPVLTATASYTKTYDPYAYNNTFYLDAESSGKEDIIYASNNTKVASVNKYGKVSIAGPGRAVITAAVEGFPSIQKKITVTVKPAKVDLLKANRTAKKNMTVKWKRDKTVTGYEITYALNKKFTKGKKTVKIGKNKTVRKTIKKLKANKTYYVKVRSYKKISGGEKIYGAYSKTIKVKAKKK